MKCEHKDKYIHGTEEIQKCYECNAVFINDILVTKEALVLPAVDTIQ